MVESVPMPELSRLIVEEMAKDCCQLKLNVKTLIPLFDHIVSDDALNLKFGEDEVCPLAAPKAADGSECDSVPRSRMHHASTTEIRWEM